MSSLSHTLLHAAWIHLWILPTHKCKQGIVFRMPEDTKISLKLLLFTCYALALSSTSIFRPEENITLLYLVIKINICHSHAFWACY